MSKSKKSKNADLHLYKNTVPLSFKEPSEVDQRFQNIHNLNEFVSPSLFFTILLSSAKEYIKSFLASSDQPNIIDLTFEEIYENNYLIIVSKEATQRDLLWYGGYFGTGNLSRSQPTWLSRKKRSLNEEKKSSQFPEDLTAQRRWKKKIIKEQQSEYDKTFKKFVNNDEKIDQSELLKSYENLKALKKDRTTSSIADLGTIEDIDIDKIQDEEEYVLTIEEYLYLKLFISNNSKYLKYVTKGLKLQPDIPLNKLISFDNLKQALVRFVVYSALRNKGYIVREGVKFGADFLVYDKKGPVFQHSDYSIVIRDFTNSEEDIMSAEDILSRLRIIGTANKKMIAMDVESTIDDNKWEKIQEKWSKSENNKTLETLFLSLIKQFSINQLLIERWLPERNR